MKRISVLILSLFILTSSGPALAEHNANITDYNTTVSGAPDTTLTINYSKTTNLDNDGVTTDYDTSGRYVLIHKRFYDSLNNSWNYTLRAEQSEMGSLTDSPTDTYFHEYYAGGDYKLYFLPDKDIFHGIGGSYTTHNDWTSNGPETETTGTAIWYYIGYGHLIDITPMAEAGNLEDRLMEVKALKSRLSKADLLKLAEIIRKWRMSEYTYINYDTGKGKFLEDITKVLEASGKLAGPLDGFSFWRISDSRVVNYSRYKGVQITFGIDDEQEYTLDHIAGSDHIRETNNFSSVTLAYYLPIDWRSQVALQSSYSRAFNPNNDFPFETSYLSLNYTYDLTNNLWAQVWGMYTRENELSNAASDANMDNRRSISAQLTYKVEDHWNLSLMYGKVYYDSWDMRELLMITNAFYW